MGSNLMTEPRNLADLGGGFIQAGTGAVQRGGNPLIDIRTRVLFCSLDF